MEKQLEYGKRLSDISSGVRYCDRNVLKWRVSDV